MAQEAAKTVTRNASMTVQEAQMILGVGEQAPWPEVMKVWGRGGGRCPPCASRAGVRLSLTAGMAEPGAGLPQAAPFDSTLPVAPPNLQRYKHLFDVNEKHGSFYLQSKVYRAWEALDEEYTKRGLKPPGAEAGDSAAPGSGNGGAAAAQQQQEQQRQQQPGSGGSETRR